jgi:hypothetical protein
MNPTRLPSRHARSGSFRGPLRAPPRCRGSTPVGAHALSRRQFLGSAAGAAGLVLGWTPGLARAGGSGEPVPIPGCLTVGGHHFNVCGPGLGTNSPDLDPSTITDFNGFVGLAFVSGMVTRTNTVTGVSRRLPFLMGDMRFMQGVFRDKEWRVRQGAFALV